ncbi:MAG: hypothetical protein LC798_19110 [Chloroflexi bacterium]|nr:hypothetical protein [Chloroflexota bacterium]
MTDGMMGRLMALGAFTPEMTLQIIGMVIDGMGTTAEWSGEELDRLGEMVQELADKIRGIQSEREQSR